MKSLIFKVATVFVAVIAITLMGAAVSVYFVHPDALSEMSTPAMQNYSFEQTTGENPKWTVKRRFAVDPKVDAAERGQVGSYDTAYEAIAKAHEDLASQKNRQMSVNAEDRNKVDLEFKAFEVSQDQDVKAIKERVAMLNTVATNAQTAVLAKSDEAQGISVKTLEVREETAARRTDVLRLRHELEEARTDLFRLNEILRHDTDELLRLELENQALEERLLQLQQQSTAGYDATE